MNNPPIELLLLKYEQNLCTPEEYKLTMEWFLTPDGQKYLNFSIDSDLKAAETKDSKDNPAIKTAFNKFLDRIEHANEKETKNQSKKFYSISWIKFAAVLLVAVLVSFFADNYFANRTTKYTTGYGTNKVIELPDHSIVTINANTQLEFKPNWNGKSVREVWLKGEAFFSITHQQDAQKFLVHTSNNFTVEVLGTKFNVLDRGNHFQVVLNSGKIRLTHDISTDKKQALLMKPGQLVEFNESQKLKVIKVEDPGQYSSWKDKIIHFNNASVDDISKVLEDSYGIKLKITDTALRLQHFSGTVPIDNEEIFLEGLSQLLQVKLSRHNNALTIEK